MKPCRTEVDQGFSSQKHIEDFKNSHIASAIFIISHHLSVQSPCLESCSKQKNLSTNSVTTSISSGTIYFAIACQELHSNKHFHALTNEELQEFSSKQYRCKTMWSLGKQDEPVSWRHVYRQS